MSLPDGSAHCAGCGSYGMTGPVLCNDCATDLRAAYAILEEILKVKERKIDELHATVIQQRAEIIQWIEAGNAGTKLINEQRAIIAAQGEKIVRLDNIIQAAHNTFTQGGTDPADDDVISLLMAKILEEALF